ncbi:MAG: vWA domain-containing protein [Planctomycetota bacterium]
MPEANHHPEQAPARDPEALDQVDQVDQIDQDLRNMLPWAVSLLLHAGLVVVAMVLVWVTIEPPQEQQPPTAVSLTPAQPAPMVQDQPELTPTQEQSPTRPSFEPSLPQISEVRFDQIGANLPSIVVPSDVDRGPRSPGRSHSDGDSDGPIFPTPGSGDADRVMFVIDASGSLIDSFPFIMNELRASISRLGRLKANTARPIEFGVVFFRNGQVLELGGPGTGLARGLNLATPANVTTAIALLSPGGANIGPGGKTDPMPAITQALRYQPQQVILLSDNITGHGIHALDPDTLVKSVLDARGQRDIRIDTVQFLYADPMSQIGRKATLARIAEQTGGQHRFVSERQLGLR